jgi:hypothetical protein
LAGKPRRTRINFNPGLGHARPNQSTFQQLGLSRLKRKQCGDLVLRLESADPGLSFVHSNAGRIDVGDQSHFAAVPAGRDPNPVKEFATWTEDLVRLAKWLLACKIDRGL